MSPLRVPLYRKSAARRVIWLLLLGSMAAPAYAQRWEILPVETVTLTAQQVLTADKGGKPATVAGYLRIPKPGTDKFPAVIMIHGGGGVAPNVDRWAQEINSIGIATFILDSFSGRGITSASQLDSLAMMIDAYRALDILAHHGRIDPNRIGVMGFSKGGVAALQSSSERFRKTYGPRNEEFAAHIALYAQCYAQYRDDDQLTGKPVRLYHGLADDWIPIEACRAYVERAKKNGADITLTEYPGATHVYDLFTLREPVKLQTESFRNCRLVEGDGGQVLNSVTQKPFDMHDPCLEKGITMVYNEAATIATVTAVNEFLTTTLHP
jgi:dienelactone hydrolase